MGATFGSKGTTPLFNNRWFFPLHFLLCFNFSLVYDDIYQDIHNGANNTVRKMKKLHLYKTMANFKTFY